MKSGFIALGILLFVGGIIALVGVTSSNKEIELRNQIAAQQEVCAEYYDKLWKVLAGKAQVADQYSTKFAEVYPALIEGRYGNEKGGALMKFVTESNPEFKTELYEELAQSIEAERAGFFMEQKKLTDLNREHRDLIQKWPSNKFVGDRPLITVKIVTSAKTKGVVATGEENDIELFNDKK